MKEQEQDQSVMAPEVRQREGQCEQCADASHLSMAAKRNRKSEAGFVPGKCVEEQVANWGADE